MYASEREERILDYLGTHGVTPTAVLQEVTGSSIATVRRDLNALSSRGLIVKTHGAARLNRDRPPPNAPRTTGGRRTPSTAKRTGSRKPPRAWSKTAT